MTLPSLWLSAAITAAVITAFLCGFTPREQLTDLKPAVFYALLMYALSVFSNLYEIWGAAQMPISAFAAAILLPRPDFLRIALRLVLIVQISALLFRTTSSMEIREALGIKIFSLFLCFIPEIFETWAAINLSWKARGGRQGFAKIKTLVFILISISMEKASRKAKALEARG